jgi:hypothetical protein
MGEEITEVHDTCAENSGIGRKMLIAKPCSTVSYSGTLYTAPKNPMYKLQNYQAFLYVLYFRSASRR